MSKIRKSLKILVIVVAVAFVLIQFARPQQTNPPIDSAMTIESVENPPENIEQILAASCNDCHSNNTVYPWYSQVAPVSWLVSHDVDEGREHLNFSEWGEFPKSKQNHKLEEICEEVEEGNMPMFKYYAVHWDARLNDEQIKALCDWTKSKMNSEE